MLAFIAALAFQTAVWTPTTLKDALEHHRLTDADVSSLTAYFGGEKKLAEGADAKVEGLNVAWALKKADIDHAVVAEVAGESPDRNRSNSVSLTLARVGKSDLFVGVSTLRSGDGFRWQYMVDNLPQGVFSYTGPMRDLEVYTMPSEAGPAVTKGTLNQQPQLSSMIFGATHDWWVYTSPGLDPAKESNLVVFQDGEGAKNYAPNYFDHLCGSGELPQTVAVFISPGKFPDGKSDRSREYDTLGDRYVRFLLEEALPQVESKYKLSQDPKHRLIAGISSGGICAFTCAWQRPDKFGLVLSWVGSFTDIASGPTLIEGGHNYPALIRKSPPKPIRVFLQDGANDLDNIHGNWPLANQQMAKALEFAKYDYKFVFGNGFHSDRHGRALMADALRWLFRS